MLTRPNVQQASIKGTRQTQHIQMIPRDLDDQRNGEGRMYTLINARLKEGIRGNASMKSVKGKEKVINRETRSNSKLPR